mgnify:CR=1 FL=1
MAIDYYEILGVARDASKGEIKSAYRNLAENYPQDINNDRKAKNDFIRISEAYAILSDDAKRNRFDLEGYDAFKPMPKEEIFKDVDLSRVLKGLSIANSVYDIIFEGTGYERSQFVANTLLNSLKSDGKHHGSLKSDLKAKKELRMKQTLAGKSKVKARVSARRSNRSKNHSTACRTKTSPRKSSTKKSKFVKPKTYSSGDEILSEALGFLAFSACHGNHGRGFGKANLGVFAAKSLIGLLLA